MSEESTQQLIPHPVTGEALDLAGATEDALAEAIDAGAELRDRITGTLAAIEDEIVKRLDRAGKWTRRIGDPGRGYQFEVKASSPTAGTTYYDEDTLAAGLDLLIEAGEIDLDAAAAALRRRVVVTFEPQTQAAMDEIRAQAEKDERVRSVEGSRQVMADGVKRLLAIGGTVAETVEEAKRTRQTGRRKPTVKRIEKEAAHAGV